MLEGKTVLLGVTGSIAAYKIAYLASALKKRHADVHVPFDLAQTCVFGKQLLGPILCGSIAGAPLLPKLRGQFAEFLNNPSPVGLRILSSSTCVGLRYGRLINTHSFSRHRASPTSLLMFGPLRPGQPTPGFGYLYVSLCLTISAATEFQPYVHRLRLSASP